MVTPGTIVSTEIVNSKYGFDSDIYAYDINRWCAPTDYAMAQGAYQYCDNGSDYFIADNIGACWWWLRSPSYYSNDSGFASNRYSGHVYSGRVVDYGDDAVRPVMFINLES